MFGKKVLIGLLSVLLVLSNLTAVFGKTTVTFWHSHTGATDRASIQRIVDEFNKQNPDIEVKVTIVPGSETDVSKLLTAIAGGVAPDVYLVDRFTAAQRAVAGVLEALNNLTTSKEFLNSRDNTLALLGTKLVGMEKYGYYHLIQTQELYTID